MRIEKCVKLIKNNLAIGTIQGIRKNILNSKQITFSQELPRHEQEKIKKCLRQAKVNHIITNKWVLIKP